MEEIKDKMQQIGQKQGQAVTLRQQLERSLALQELWPGVFSADARVAVQWQNHDGIRMVIKRTVPLPYNEKTEERTYTLAQLPDCMKSTMPTTLALAIQERERKQAVMDKLKGVTP